MKSHTTLRVQFRDLDPYAHVNHAVYVTWFEIARTDALRARGMVLAGTGALAVQFVVTELEVRYRLPAVAEDVVRVDTWISELRGASTRWRHEIWRNDDLLVDGSVRVAVVGADGRPARISADLRAALSGLTAD
jgi:acyl-CoA thioester hydrolase